MSNSRRYLALLRGVNVGGNSLIKMSGLRTALEKAGFDDVRTYIQSGNVIFSSSETDTDKLASKVQTVISNDFGINTSVVVFSKAKWEQIVNNAPDWWGSDKEWKHNLLVLLPPYNMDEVVSAIGVLKPEIESIEPGEGVLYQSMSIKLFGRTTTGKLASNPIYKRMTIRNYNTSTKLLGKLDI